MTKKNLNHLLKLFRAKIICHKVYSKMIIIALITNSIVLSQKEGFKLQKSLFIPAQSRFNINNISTPIYNNGKADLGGADSDFRFPKESKKTAIYCSGFVWGANVNGKVWVGGSTYDSGLQPGKILNEGYAENPNSDKTRVFRVRRNFRSADLTMESKDENKSIDEIYYQYEKDWNEWPALNGAPFEDVDENGIYNQEIDYPGIPGADQTLWYVANDLDSNQTKSLYGSLPLGIELQVSVWGYDSEPPLGNAVFKKYVIINKSRNNFDDMYFGIWSDPDLGDAGDDLVGCDTTLNVGFVYNGKSTDGQYMELNPPSIGVCLLQGPIVNGIPGNTARFKGRIIDGKKNLSMTAFSYIYKNSVSPYADPIPENYETGTLAMYNLLQGLLNDGTPHPLPISLGNGFTKFPYSGDPVTHTGFVGGSAVLPDGLKDGPSDHRQMLCTGPFNMASDDTQEVVFMQVAAGADGHTDYLSAVNLMKYYTNILTSQYFNPQTQLSSNEKVNIKATLFNEQVLLNWGEDQSQINKIENGDYNYKFQGYNVYQFPSAESKLEDGKLVATFDIVDGVKQIIDSYYNPQSQKYESNILQNGSDSGIQRFLLIDKDYINNKPLIIGDEYYFGVTHYSINLDDRFVNNLESGLNILNITAGNLPRGFSSTNKYSDKIYAARNFGVNSTNTVNAFIIDPTKLTGDQYQVTFHSSGSSFVYSLTNTSKNKILFEGAASLRTSFDCLITEGFIIQVLAQKNYLKDGDYFTFTTTAPKFDSKESSDEINKINVFPNPYYSQKMDLVSEYNRHVTFTHLQNHAIIRIFNLAGELVIKLEKNDDSQILKWYLMNEHNFLVPSGLYIVHIELPETGQNKILKLAVIQGELIPD